MNADFQGKELEVFLEADGARCKIRVHSPGCHWAATADAGLVNLSAVTMGIRYDLMGHGCACSIVRMGDDVLFKCSNDDGKHWALRVPLTQYREAIAKLDRRVAYVA